MKVLIQVLDRSEAVKDHLRANGWKLETLAGHSLAARHPQVATAGDARQRLQDIGLLTSRTLRIEFPFEARVRAAV